MNNCNNSLAVFPFLLRSLSFFSPAHATLSISPNRARSRCSPTQSWGARLKENWTHRWKYVCGKCCTRSKKQCSRAQKNAHILFRIDIFDIFRTCVFLLCTLRWAINFRKKWGFRFEGKWVKLDRRNQIWFWDTATCVCEKEKGSLSAQVLCPPPLTLTGSAHGTKIFLCAISPHDFFACTR